MPVRNPRATNNAGADSRRKIVESASRCPLQDRDCIKPRIVRSDQIGSQHAIGFAAITRHAGLVLGLAGPSFVASHFSSLGLPMRFDSLVADFNGPSFTQCSIFDGNPGCLGGFDSKRHALADSSIGINDAGLCNTAPRESSVDSLLPFACDSVPQDSGLRIKQVRSDRTFSPHKTVPDGGAGIPTIPDSLKKRDDSPVRISGIRTFDGDAAHLDSSGCPLAFQ
jgi:hypothetical protein